MRWSDVRAAMVGDDPVCSGSPSDRVALHQPGIGRGLQDLAVARAGAETTLAPVAADLDAMPAPTELLDGRGGQSPLAADLAGARLPPKAAAGEGGRLPGRPVARPPAGPPVIDVTQDEQD